MDLVTIFVVVLLLIIAGTVVHISWDIYNSRNTLDKIAEELAKLNKEK